MTYEELGNRNLSEGIPALFRYVSDVEPVFFPLILFAFFIIVSVGSYFAQKETIGRGNFKASLAVAGYLTTGVAYVLSLIPGVIGTFTVMVCFILSVLFTLFLLLPER